MADLEITRSEFLNEIKYMTDPEVADHLEALGLRFQKDLPPLEVGIYRRVHGQDLVYWDGTGWNYVNIFSHTNFGPEEISWDVGYHNGDDWVLVLNDYHQPVVNGMVITMNSDGIRVG